MERELNNRAIWYPKCEADMKKEGYKESMFYHLTEGVFKPFVDLVRESENNNTIPTLMLCFRSNQDSVTIYYKNHNLQYLHNLLIISFYKTKLLTALQ